MKYKKHLIPAKSASCRTNRFFIIPTNRAGQEATGLFFGMRRRTASDSSCFLQSIRDYSHVLILNADESLPHFCPNLAGVFCPCFINTSI